MTTSHARPAALVLVALLATGCGGADATDVATDIDPTTTASASGPAADATSDLAAGVVGDLAGTDLPEGFPTDIPVPTGFVPTATDSRLDDTTSSFTLEGRVDGDEDPARVVEHLVAAWRDRGWEVVDQSTDPAGTDVADIGFTRDDDTASVSLTRNDDGLALSVTMDVASGMAGMDG